MNRGTGKTTKLIKMSSENNIPIGYVRTTQKQFILDKAKSMGVNIPEPVYLGDLFDGKKVDKIYLDDFDLTLNAFFGCNVEAVTISNNKSSDTDLIITLKNSLYRLTDHYYNLINRNNYNEAINVMKNIQMVTQVLIDIDKNSDIGKVFEDLANCWDGLETDEVSKAMIGDR